MSAFMIYWFFAADEWVVFFGLVMLIVAICLVIALYYCIGAWNDLADGCEDRRIKNDMIYKTSRRYVKILANILFVVCVITTIMPSTKALTAMYVLPRITKNKAMAQIPGYLTKYIKSVLIEKTNEAARRASDDK